MSTQKEKLRTVIRKLVSEQINTDRRLVTDLDKLDKAVKTLNKDYRALINNSFSRIVLDDGNSGNTFDVQIYPVMDIDKDGMGKYDVRAYIHDSDRCYKKGLSCDELCDFVKNELKGMLDTDESYVRKALKKGKRSTWNDSDYEYSPTLVAESKQSRIDVIRLLKRKIDDVRKRKFDPDAHPHDRATADNVIRDLTKKLNYHLNKRNDEMWLMEDKEAKKRKDDCSCEKTVGEMEEVKKFKKQDEWKPKDLTDVAMEELIPGVSLDELAEKIEGAVWGAIKRHVEPAHKKTAKAEHDVKDSDTAKNKHTLTKSKRIKSKTAKVNEKAKPHEHSVNINSKNSKINTPATKDFKADERKAKKTGKDEEYTKAKKNKQIKESVRDYDEDPNDPGVFVNANKIEIGEEPTMEFGIGTFDNPSWNPTPKLKFFVRVGGGYMGFKKKVNATRFKKIRW